SHRSAAHAVATRRGRARRAAVHSDGGFGLEHASTKMAPIVPDKKKIRSFRSEAAFEAWLSENHARETEVWLRIYKKGAGKPTVTADQAVDVALCWGWIDGLRKAFDELSFLQRYTPRRAAQRGRQNARGGPPAHRGGPGRRALGRGVCAHSEREHREHSGGPAPSGGGEPPRARDVRATQSPEPVRAEVPDREDEDGGG